jgi:hypothetical protein
VCERGVDTLVPGPQKELQHDDVAAPDDAETRLGRAGEEDVAVGEEAVDGAAAVVAQLEGGSGQLDDFGGEDVLEGRCYKSVCASEGVVKENIRQTSRASQASLMGTDSGYLSTTSSKISMGRSRRLWVDAMVGRIGVRSV